MKNALRKLSSVVVKPEQLIAIVCPEMLPEGKAAELRQALLQNSSALLNLDPAVVSDRELQKKLQALLNPHAGLTQWDALKLLAEVARVALLDEKEKIAAFIGQVPGGKSTPFYFDVFLSIGKTHYESNPTEMSHDLLLLALRGWHAQFLEAIQVVTDLAKLPQVLDETQLLHLRAYARYLEDEQPVRARESVFAELAQYCESLATAYQEKNIPQSAPTLESWLMNLQGRVKSIALKHSRYGDFLAQANLAYQYAVSMLHLLPVDEAKKRRASIAPGFSGRLSDAALPRPRAESQSKQQASGSETAWKAYLDFLYKQSLFQVRTGLVPDIFNALEILMTLRPVDLSKTGYGRAMAGIVDGSNIFERINAQGATEEARAKLFCDYLDGVKAVCVKTTEGASASVLAESEAVLKAVLAKTSTERMEALNEVSVEPRVKSSVFQNPEDFIIYAEGLCAVFYPGKIHPEVALYLSSLYQFSSDPQREQKALHYKLQRLFSLDNKNARDALQALVAIYRERYVAVAQSLEALLQQYISLELRVNFVLALTNQWDSLSIVEQQFVKDYLIINSQSYDPSNLMICAKIQASEKIASLPAAAVLTGEMNAVQLQLLMKAMNAHVRLSDKDRKLFNELTGLHAAFLTRGQIFQETLKAVMQEKNAQHMDEVKTFLSFRLLLIAGVSSKLVESLLFGLSAHEAALRKQAVFELLRKQLAVNQAVSSICQKPGNGLSLSIFVYFPIFRWSLAIETALLLPDFSKEAVVFANQLINCQERILRPMSSDSTSDQNRAVLDNPSLFTNLPYFLRAALECEEVKSLSEEQREVAIQFLLSTAIKRNTHGLEFNALRCLVQFSEALEQPGIQKSELPFSQLVLGLGQLFKMKSEKDVTGRSVSRVSVRDRTKDLPKALIDLMTFAKSLFEKSPEIFIQFTEGLYYAVLPALAERNEQDPVRCAVIQEISKRAELSLAVRMRQRDRCMVLLKSRPLYKDAAVIFKALVNKLVDFGFPNDLQLKAFCVGLDQGSISFSDFSEKFLSALVDVEARDKEAKALAAARAKEEQERLKAEIEEQAKLERELAEKERERMIASKVIEEEAVRVAAEAAKAAEKKRKEDLAAEREKMWVFERSPEKVAEDVEALRRELEEGRSAQQPVLSVFFGPSGSIEQEAATSARSLIPEFTGASSEFYPDPDVSEADKPFDLAAALSGKPVDKRPRQATVEIQEGEVKITKGFGV